MTCVARTPRLSGLALAPPGQASVRRLMWATLITSFGNGAWYTCWALFLTRTVGIAFDSRAAYLAVALVNAGSFLVYALTVAALPSVGRHPLPRPTATAALRDLPYLTLAAIAGVLALCWGMLSSGLPLWVARHTLAPLWTSAVI